MILKGNMTYKPEFIKIPKLCNRFLIKNVSFMLKLVKTSNTKKASEFS